MKKKTVFLVMVLVLSLGCGIMALAKDVDFSNNGVAAKATLTSGGSTVGAVTAQTSGDTCYAFAQAAACKADGTYLKAADNTQVGYVWVTCTYTGLGCKRHRGLHSLKNDQYKPLASYSWYIDK